MARRRPETRSEQKAATRELLVRVARKVFARDGFDATSILGLCEAAGVTHGALYHHFPSKTDLFVAVVDELTREVAAKVQSAADGARGWAQIEAACDAYLDVCTTPAVQTILFRDGPRALSSDVAAAIDHAANDPLVVGLLQRWIEQGLLRPVPVPLAARLLGGAFAEAGAAIASAATGDRARVRDDASKLLLAFVGAMKKRG